MVERVSSGVAGLDEMIEGGYINNSSVLISGGSGSGKSTMAMQFLVYGAKNKIPGVYISFEEDPNNIKRNMIRHGWDITTFEQEKLMRVLRIDPQDMMHIIKQEYGVIVDAIKDLDAKLVVLDSLSVLETMFEGDYARRQGLLKLISWLQKTGCTAVMVYERVNDPGVYSDHGIVEYMVDGVIALYNIRKSTARIRALEVLKMRGTDVVTKLVPFIIKEGIHLRPNQMIFGGLKN